MSLSLADTQRLLWRAITAPEGAARLVEQEPSLRSLLDETVRGHGPLDAVARVDIYGNMYFFRLLDVLREDYPAVLAAVGDVAFHNLVTDYLLAHPPTHFSLRWAGRHLAGFLERHELRHLYPCLPDLARFEWTLGESFDAADRRCVTADDLRRFAPEQWEVLRLRWHPAVRFLATEWPVDEIRDALRSGEAEGFPGRWGRAARRYCVWRAEMRVFFRAVDAWEWAMFDTLRAGGSFGEACEAAAGLLPLDEAPVRAAGALGRWVADGLVADVSA